MDKAKYVNMQEDKPRIFDIILLLSTVILIAINIFQLPQHMDSFFSNLVAEIEYSKVELPPSIIEEIKENSVPGYVCFVKIENYSSRPRSSVTIKLPDTYLAKVSKEGSEPVVNKVIDIINIGELKPKEIVFITAWLKYISDIDAVRLSYSNGLGKVIIKRPIEMPSPLYLMLFTVCLILLLARYVFLAISYTNMQDKLKRVIK